MVRTVAVQSRASSKLTLENRSEVRNMDLECGFVEINYASARQSARRVLGVHYLE